MVSIKVLLVTCCLLASASCTIPLLLGNHGGHSGGIRGGSRDYNGGGLIGSILTGLTRILKVTFQGIFKDAVHTEVPATIDDGLNLFGEIGLAVGKIIDVVVPGLGDKFSKVLVSLSRALICLLGSPGLSGKIIHDRRPGRFNSRLTCNGLDHYRRGGSNAQDYDWTAIYQSLGLTGVGGEISGLLKKHKNKAQSYSISLVFEQTTTISAIVNKKSFKQQDFSKVVECVFIMFAGISNSHQANAGTKLINIYYEAMNKVLSNNKLPPMPSSKDDVINKIKGCNGDEAIWADNGEYNDNNNNNDNENNNDNADNDNGDNETDNISDNGNHNGNANENSENNSGYNNDENSSNNSDDQTPKATKKAKHHKRTTKNDKQTTRKAPRHTKSPKTTEADHCDD